MIFLALLLAVAAALFLLSPSSPESAKPPAAAVAAPKPALTVTLTRAEQANWPQRVEANGTVAAWQEAVIGAEAAGLRTVEVLVNVGDRVTKGQLLAQLQTETINAEIQQTRAGIAEAEATVAEAMAVAARARKLKDSGFVSSQQADQSATAELTARARLASLKSRLVADEVRLGQTRIVAPDAGVISARVATVGAVVQPGQELFRLIRGGRLEWRAEVQSADLSRIAPGMAARVVTAGGAGANGKVRVVAPTVDAQTRNGLVYVDLPAPGDLKPGMFARGEFELGSSSGMTLPQTAVLLRDGFSYVFTVGADSRVTMTKVDVGRRIGDRMEIAGGLPADARVVASGVGFLSDGDTVRVVEAAAPSAEASGPVPNTAR